MKICVLGGLGYIGSGFGSWLHLKGYDDITIVDNLYFKQAEIIEPILKATKTRLDYMPDLKEQKITIYKEDVREHRRWNDYDVIINLAAYVGAPLCNKLPKEEVISLNQTFVENLTKHLSREQLLIYPNTNSSYGYSTEDICTEDSPRQPLSLYAETKDNAEKAVLDFGGIAYRLATVCGPAPRMRWDLMVNDFCLKAYRNHQLDIFEPHYKRNFINVMDIHTALEFAIANREEMQGQVYNLGLDSGNTTKGELAQQICKHFGAEYIVSEGNDPDKRNYNVSSQKLYNLGYQPIHTLAATITMLDIMFIIMKGKEIDGPTTRNV